MDNLRKTNAFFGSVLKDINTDTTDEELDNLSNCTLGHLGELLMALPDKVKDMKYGDLMTIVLSLDEDEDKMIETLDRIFGITSEEEAMEILESLGNLGAVICGSEEDP